MLLQVSEKSLLNDTVQLTWHHPVRHRVWHESHISQPHPWRFNYVTLQSDDPQIPWNTLPLRTMSHHSEGMSQSCAVAGLSDTTRGRICEWEMFWATRKADARARCQRGAIGWDLGNWQMRTKRTLMLRSPGRHLAGGARWKQRREAKWIKGERPSFVFP